ncbi:MAG: EAL domain-containing protein [Sulfurimonadaceae bacterium]|nr:EAL domain-containing protein [Sulfurimonadaceae bacterium]
MKLDPLSSGISYPIKKSIKIRVIWQVSLLIGLTVFGMGLMATLLSNYQMQTQMKNLLSNNAYATQHRIEERLQYLVDSTLLLARNEFIINALIDAKKRESYLTPIVDNFIESKDIVALGVVDFDGATLYKTLDKMPTYATSQALRSSLALGKEVIFFDEATKNIILMVPIRYYNTTQGAIIAVFNTKAIGARLLPNDSNTALMLYKGENLLYSYRHDASKTYTFFKLAPLDKTFWIQKLGLVISLGALEDDYLLPIKRALFYLSLMGFLFMTLGIIAAYIVANKITYPILELYKRVRNSDGSEDTLCSPMGTDDEIDALAKVFDEHSLMLQYQARHDLLTSLPNRLLFLDRLEQAIMNSINGSTMVAVLFLDLDHFKEINDSFGHSVGDKLLQNIGHLLAEVTKKSDTIARLGGDEFAILLPDIHNENKVIDSVNDVMEKMKEIHKIDGHEFYISCSIGIALYPQNGSSSDEILKNADAAMYKAKDKGRNNYQFYTKNMTDKAYERIILETQLRKAIENEELLVYLQPQVNMLTKDKDIIGMEALVRWIKEDGTMISPAEFIPLAEDTRLIVPLDRLVMKKALKSFSAWKRDGLDTGVLSLNLSMMQLATDDFVEVASNMVREYGLETQTVMFEVTETQIMSNPDDTIKVLKEIRALGFKIAIDDFGTGQSSLSYLKRLPINKIKIDQSFVRDLAIDKDDMELTRAIIAIAHSLNLSVIAEGVETEEQAKFLKNHKCFEAQGYLYYRPMPIAQIEEILKKKKLEKILSLEA